MVLNRSFSISLSVDIPGFARGFRFALLRFGFGELPAKCIRVGQAFGYLIRGMECNLVISFKPSVPPPVFQRRGRLYFPLLVHVVVAGQFGALGERAVADGAALALEHARTPERKIVGLRRLPLAVRRPPLGPSARKGEQARCSITRPSPARVEGPRVRSGLPCWGRRACWGGGGDGVLPPKSRQDFRRRTGQGHHAVERDQIVAGGEQYGLWVTIITVRFQAISLKMSRVRFPLDGRDWSLVRPTAALAGRRPAPGYGDPLALPPDNLRQRRRFRWRSRPSR